MSLTPAAELLNKATDAVLLLQVLEDKLYHIATSQVLDSIVETRQALSRATAAFRKSQTP
jgi:hypothetical protein